MPRRSYAKLETAGPMTLGEFRKLTAELPDATLLFHEYDGMLVQTGAAESVQDLPWRNREVPISERTWQVAPTSVITAADGYNLWGP